MLENAMREKVIVDGSINLSFPPGLLPLSGYIQGPLSPKYPQTLENSTLLSGSFGLSSEFSRYLEEETGLVFETFQIFTFVTPSQAIVKGLALFSAL